jgi:pyruvate dehydrogenase E1 component alpha subunit
MDVLAVKAAGEKAVAHCRAGKGPYILEVMTYRYRGHSMSDPAKYRTREEVQEMREKRDAIENVRQMLLTGKHATEDDLKKIDKEIKDIINEAAEFSKESPEPALEELWTDIYADVAPQNA